MPIMIDTNSDDLSQQIKDINNKIALNKQVDAKFFSECLTGNGKRLNGFLSKKIDSINDFRKENKRLLDNLSNNAVKEKDKIRFMEQTFGNHFDKSSKSKENHFKLFESNLTTMVPPIIINSLLDTGNPIALSIPKDIGMYNMNAMENTWTKITTGIIDNIPVTTYVLPVIQSVDLYSKEIISGTTGNNTKKQIVMAAQPDIYIIFATIADDMDQDGDIVFANQRVNGGKAITKSQGVASISPLLEVDYAGDYDYFSLFDDLENHLRMVIANGNMPPIPRHDLSQIIGGMSTAEILESQAMTIVHQSDETLLKFADVLSKRADELQTKEHKYIRINRACENSLIAFIQHLDVLNDLEDDLIATDLLADIFNVMKNNLKDKSVLNSIVRHSLRLLLSQRLHELNDIRNNDGLYKFEPNDDFVKNTMIQNPDYSMPQKNIITTTDPLVIGQAGAGSGKSHTLIGRINYLKDQGEDLSKVLVLSFTNVSAININNRFPGVRSETLANMFHTIYSATYPGQQLSQPSTVANALRLLNPASNYFKALNLDENELIQFIHDFAIRLEQFDQTGFKRVNLQHELKRLSNLIEGNLEMTTHILNAVEQTTLELEPIIIHHMLLLGAKGLNIPKEYQELNYIITDESQDISTFEYILLLELTIHYRSQLLIIGDGSQTLYEFRNSDPRYMNALESSNVFTSHKLETNYRSNEEILMYANQFLQIIDANKYAKIQLQSAQFSSPTEDSVKEMITISDNEILGGTQKDYTEGLTRYMQQDKEFHDWLVSRVRKGEQVALMGWTRKEVIEAGAVIEEILKHNGLGHIEVTNIMSDNQRPMTILSKFARFTSDTLRSLDPTNPQYLDEIDRHANMFISQHFRKSSMKQSSFYNDFINRSVKQIVQTAEWSAWLMDYRKKKINQYQVGSFLIQQLLRIETRKNAMDQYLRKQKEVPNYDECPIIISTIHGTKGLEFDHCVVLFNESKRGSTSQESLRMMFVALSRAKKSEYIINSHRSSTARSVTNTHGGMFETPINTAFLRTLDDVKKLNNTPAISAI